MNQETRAEAEARKEPYRPSEGQESASKTDPRQSPRRRAPQPGMTSWPGR
jgi:hypothetical protein